VGLFKKKKQPAPNFSDAKVYYSTPFGDTKDGRQKPFLLERDGVQYLPVFRSVESMKEFYERTNRAAYMILEGDVQRVLDTNRSFELMKRVGIVIDPLSEHPVEIMPDL
jgi:SseB protein N-terminal domain